MRTLITILLSSLFVTGISARVTYNFNPAWKLFGKTISLPHAWNEDEAYGRPIAELSDSIVEYSKTFRLPKMKSGSRVILEFEGARMAAEVFVNGRRMVLSEDGIAAFGCDITDAIKKGENSIRVVTDNDWSYRERERNSRFQWNDKNFNVNYGGLQKNVRLHIVPEVYQTLPLINTLGTTGQYIYAKNYDIANRTADVHVETEVLNTTNKDVYRQMTVTIEDPDGNIVASYESEKTLIPARQKAVITAESRVNNLHFWSWGYGYLYKVHTAIQDDEVVTMTGFRKAEFTDGMIYLNDRVIHIHGYAQRSSNEWPGVGMSVSPWLADYGNDLCVKGGGNLVRWMHICPWKQEIESCDRVGLIEAMPAGDSEADVNDVRWDMRKEVMRASIVYNRNNPSILFYECGNKGISREHLIEMKAIRDSYDPHGMRAIGSREMLDIDEAEYGGEMMYINKSATKPMWMMEYCRDEGLRKYWNSWTPTNLNRIAYSSKNGEDQSSRFKVQGSRFKVDTSHPFSAAPQQFEQAQLHSVCTRIQGSSLLYHSEGYGPLYKNAPANSYNHNSDEFAVELVRRWYDYWLERPGTGDFVNSGGAKIVFADTHTHCRSEMNYRLSGVVDAMRIPKDGYYAHQVMWDGWVDDIAPHTYIMGHWNYDAETLGDAKVDTVPVVYVVSNEDETPVLTINGKNVNVIPQHECKFLYAYKNVPFEAGELKATCSNSSWSINTSGVPVALKLTPISNPSGWKADGADVALVQFEVVDAHGRRCPLDNRMVHFTLTGPGEWRGGIAQVKQWTETDGPEKYNSDNMAMSDSLPVECGVNRVMLRSLLGQHGEVMLTAKADGLPETSITLSTIPFEMKDGLSLILPNAGMKGRLDRGETPLTASFVKSGEDVRVITVESGSNQSDAKNTIDRNERTTWASSSNEGEQWISFTLERKTTISEIVLKMGDFRTKSYPIEVMADGVQCYKGDTYRTMSYVHIPVGNVSVKEFTIRLAGTTTNGDAFANVKELDSKNDDRVSKGKKQLRIIEAQFIHRIDNQ